MFETKRVSGVVLLLAGLGTGAGAVRRAAAQGPEWYFVIQSATPIELPSWLSSDSLRAALFYRDASQAVAGFTADLNQDGVPDYVFRLSVEGCGSNCEYVLVDGASHRTLGRVGGSVVYVRPPLINGYPVIQSYSHGSANSGRWAVSVFDGKHYVFVGGVELEGESLRRLFASLREIPYWP